MREPQDSTGKAIRVGDTVIWRGQFYTIKSFGDLAGRFGTIEFEEPLHIEGEIPDEISVDLVEKKSPGRPTAIPTDGEIAVTTAYDPVEDQYPQRSLCPACRKYQPVHESGEHVGKIVQHVVVDTQISIDDRYACTVEYACPGSLAKVSKWKRIGR